MAEDYTIENIYQGGYSSLSPSYGDVFTGYHASAGSLGLSGDPRTADILSDVSKKIASGIKTFELSLVNPEVMETIPKQHLDEVNRLSKLTGVDITVHGPLIDASGIGERGFDDSEREIAERKIAYTLEKSHQINPNGNVPVTFHTSNQLPAVKYSKKDGKEIKEVMPIVNQESGEVNIVKRDERYSPESGGEKQVLSINDTLQMMNNTSWRDSLTQVEFQREYADKILQDVHPIEIGKYLKWRSEGPNQKKLSPEDIQSMKKIISANEHIHEGQKTADSLFNKAYKYGNNEEKKKLVELSKNYKKNLGIKSNGEVDIDYLNPQVQSQALFELKQGLSTIRPQVFKDAGEFATEKSQETFGNAAWQAYKKFGTKAPILNIENPPAGVGLSRAKDVKSMIQGSRKQFVDNATKNGMSKSRAEKEAEKLIGATWDVGHINELRQFGFSGKDILKEAEEIAPFVKHMHLADNFGMHTTVEMPMGMGNVDLKGVMKKLGKKGKEAKKIIEAGNWWQHHSNQGALSPVGPTLEALGSPIYGMNMAPYWNQVSGYQEGYFGGHGQTFPQINYETFGAGFSNLPTELGGQRPGAAGGRMSGTPME